MHVERSTNGEGLPAGSFRLNGKIVSDCRYAQYHARRIRRTIDALRSSGARRIIELGGHPWWMTSQLVDEPQFELCASVSAEEVAKWPDELSVTSRQYTLETTSGRSITFPNYSANLERTLFDIPFEADTVIACEIIEHLLRAPHIMLLNMNRWLPVGGKILITTPNNAHFSNPFRERRSRAYRCHIYSKHHFTYALEELVDLVSLCGFRVLDADYWDVYDRRGPSRVYGWLSRIPLTYCRRKFFRTICVSAEKTSDSAELDRLPSIYEPSSEWEYVRQHCDVI